MNELMTLPEVAARLRVPEATVRDWRAHRKGPQGFKVGRRVLYRREAVDLWLADQEAAEMRRNAPDG